MEDEIKQKTLNTGTTTVGLVSKDGIVLGADKRVTLGGRIVANRKFEKVVLINKDIAVTTAGSVSDIQLLVKILKAQLKLLEMRRDKKITVKEVANLLGGLVYNNIRKFSMIPGITGFLLGGADNNGFYLYEIGMDGSATLYDDYATDGSGMMFATGVLESSYKPDISLKEAITLAGKAINAAIQRDTATGDGLDIVTITKKGAQKILTKEITTIIREI